MKYNSVMFFCLTVQKWKFGMGYYVINIHDIEPRIPGRYPRNFGKMTFKGIWKDVSGSLFSQCAKRVPNIDVRDVLQAHG